MITLSFVSKLKVTDTLCIYTYDFERETLERRDERDRWERACHVPKDRPKIAQRS